MRVCKPAKPLSIPLTPPPSSVNPVLEAFGNAKTVRNNNSSRFGKFTEIHFDAEGHVAHASIETYLLEKSRVVGQAPGERNYHVFYNLLAGATAEERARLQLAEGVPFRILGSPDDARVAGVDDAAAHDEVRAAFRTLSVPDADVAEIMAVVAAVLHLGNVEFVEDSAHADASAVADAAALQRAASALGCDAALLERSMTSQEMSVGRERIVRPISVENARFARDTLCKAVYSELFDWVVGRVNRALRTDEPSAYFIGVLDIYGFESFAKNSFEQLCINFANEKLQQHFNREVFVQEQQIYAREGIKCETVEFEDNQDCIDLIEARGSGILALLDEQGQLPKGSDQLFCENLYAKHAKGSARLQTPKQVRALSYPALSHVRLCC